MGVDFLKFCEEYTLATEQVSITLGEPLREHTSFGLGGPADLFIRPYSAEALALGLKLCARADIAVYILGRGTNLLVSDKGISGAVFDMTALNHLKIEGCRMQLGAGLSLSQAAMKAADAGLKGLEFAHGIPGTVGGALVMNAGAYGGEIGLLVRSVSVMDRQGNIYDLDAVEMDFSYRHSRLQEGEEIVLSALLELETGNRDDIRETMAELARKRKEKQPLDQRSAGSTFKRPPGHFAGQLIEEAGLKGFSLGDAAVSEKHAGFVINRGRASAREVNELCQTVIRRVREYSGISLELEIRRWGDFT